MVEESDRHWACIASRRYNFGARRDEVAHLRLVTLQQVQVGRRCTAGGRELAGSFSG